MAESKEKPGTDKHAVKIKSILVTQPKPTNDNSPYLTLAQKYGIKVDFREFIQVEPVPYKEFRKDKVNILEHTAVILCIWINGNFKI